MKLKFVWNRKNYNKPCR